MLSHCWLLRDQEVAFNLPSFAPNGESFSDYISPWLGSKGYNASKIRSEKDVYIQDDQITVHLVNQALDFLQRAVCNAIGHYLLARKGLETWARVTNYYAGYFAVHSLLCLQGRTITRIKLDSDVQVMVLPLNLRAHQFAITLRGLGKNPHHQTPWNRYYEIYDRYPVSHAAYERISKRAYVADPMDESAERNRLRACYAL
jgi:hypothetical protein